MNGPVSGLVWRGIHTSNRPNLARTCKLQYWEGPLEAVEMYWSRSHGKLEFRDRDRTILKLPSTATPPSLLSCILDNRFCHDAVPQIRHSGERHFVIRRRCPSDAAQTDRKRHSNV